MGYYISSSTGYGLALGEEDVEAMWDLYETREDASAWVVEDRDEYTMLEEFFGQDSPLTVVQSYYMGESIGWRCS